MISSCPVLQGFGNHIDKDHNMWDYVYYSFYLDSIDTSNHTALQKYVFNLVRESHHAAGIAHKQTMLSTGT